MAIRDSAHLGPASTCDLNVDVVVNLCCASAHDDVEGLMLEAETDVSPAS